jgi:hypothetical protein
MDATRPDIGDAPTVDEAVRTPAVGETYGFESERLSRGLGEERNAPAGALEPVLMGSSVVYAVLEYAEPARLNAQSVQRFLLLA